MYRQQQHQHFDFRENDESESQASYAKIIQWSVDKIAADAVAAGQRRRRSSSVDLRRSLLIAGTMVKARAGLLRQRAMQFLEARPQLLPPTGWHVNHHHSPVLSQQQQLLPQQTESAFGYSQAAADVTEVDEDPDDADDALSASAQAIVMSSVELSIGVEEQPQAVVQQSPPQSRKRKQQLPPPPPKPQPPAPPPPPPSGYSPAKRTGGLRSLQASFVDLSMSSPSGSCRRQASQFNGALASSWLPSGPECHSFA